MSSERTEAYIAGRNAWASFEFECPYPEGSKEASDWDCGWLDVAAELEE